MVMVSIPGLAATNPQRVELLTVFSFPLRGYIAGSVLSFYNKAMPLNVHPLQPFLHPVPPAST